MVSLNIDVTPRQMAFMDAMEFEVLYGGAAGGGKSHGQMLDAELYALKYPGSRQLILRRTFPELQRSLIPKSFEIFYPVAVWNGGKKLWSFATGSTVEFGYCANINDVYQYQSAEYDVIRFDELTHFLEGQYIYLLSRCRGANRYPKQIKSATNPGGVGHAWVKERFIDAAPPKTPIVDGITGLKRIFIPAKVQDNSFLMQADPEYILRLQNLDENNRKALLDGNWDIFAGQYFTEFDRGLHVMRPFELPANWRRYVTLDYGLDMLAAYWIAVDDMGRAYVYRELYEGRDSGHAGHIASAAARRILELTPKDEDIYAHFAPPDLWNKHQDSGESTADYFWREGINLQRAGNERIQGWLALKEWLKPYTDEHERFTANLRIFDNCVNLIRCLPGLVHDERNVNDVAKEPHELTHGPDALRYFVAGRPSPNYAAPPEPKYNFDFEKPRPSAYGGKIVVM